MAAVEDEGDAGCFSTGIPNEQYLPQIHVLSLRRNHSLNTNSILRKSLVNETTVKTE